MESTIKIEGMTCKHCQMRVEKTLSSLDGVEKVTVDLEKGLAHVQSNTSLNETILKEKIDDAGYKVISIE
ncbi:Copper chaperone CopZ [Acholeplasma oculi]|uniref:Copper chaperone CopZ n=1 Tax=Acholeplasma oculi TaxID=35623 RepID=A0A061AHG2_9MOLU|nr:heavy metal-associated domain-containing protein [Acholeplasma oculi]CDR30422.1 Copper ion binding protein [Acholeplasma oculi]SKC50472.1 copper ion binding protein [Acholeplasma oculi]SUT88987.1 Copper chaperone CopZ [Acholeplasma oculi]